MARQKSAQLTAAEQKIMDLLWRDGAMTVRDLTERLSAEQPVAYTTVQTICRILLDKGHVEAHKAGKAFVYQALTVQQEARSVALLQLLKKFFGGSPDALAQHLLQEQTLTPELALQLQAKIDQARSPEQASSSDGVSAFNHSTSLQGAPQHSDSDQSKSDHSKPQHSHGVQGSDAATSHATPSSKPQ